MYSKNVITGFPSNLIYIYIYTRTHMNDFENPFDRGLNNYVILRAILRIHYAMLRTPFFCNGHYAVPSALLLCCLGH